MLIDHKLIFLSPMQNMIAGEKDFDLILPDQPQLAKLTALSDTLLSGIA